MTKYLAICLDHMHELPKSNSYVTHTHYNDYWAMWRLMISLVWRSFMWPLRIQPWDAPTLCNEGIGMFVCFNHSCQPLVNSINPQIIFNVVLISVTKTNIIHMFVCLFFLWSLHNDHEFYHLKNQYEIFINSENQHISMGMVLGFRFHLFLFFIL